MSAQLLRPCLHIRLARLQGATQRHRHCIAHGRQRQRPMVTNCAADEVLRSMSKGGELAVLVAECKQLVQEGCTRHKTAPTASAALGRTLIGTLLMGSFKEEDERTQVTFKGNGELGDLQCVADTAGNVKGTMSNPAADPPLHGDGKLNVSAAVGQGILAVVRSHSVNDHPYQGMVPIASGEIAEDLAHYMADSEQVNSAIGLGVSINRDSSIRAAGGFLIQVLPFASDETLDQLEVNIRNTPSVTELLHEGLGTKEITERLLEGIGLSDIAPTSMQPRYGPCEKEDLKERMKRAVALLGPEEVNDIIQEQGKIEVTCDFCAETYQFEEEEILAAAPKS